MPGTRGSARRAMETEPRPALPAGAAAPPDDVRVPAACLALFAVASIALGIAPAHREDWLLENLPIFIVVPALVASYRRFRFSDRAYLQGTVFLLLHAIGSHWTYSEVPLGHWLARVLDLDRNHYDRIVHFLAGALLLRPIRELAFRGREPGPIATLLLPVCAVGAGSALYEVIEWLVARAVDPAAGTAFLGTQGDEWDAQKDMALAGLGAILAAVAERLVDPPRGRTGAGHGSR